MPPGWYLSKQYNTNFIYIVGNTTVSITIQLPGRVAQSVACLATDACLTVDPGVPSSIPVRSGPILSWSLIMK